MAIAVFTQLRGGNLYRDGFLSRLTFGSVFLERALPEMRALHPPATSRTGYDGQFYGQLAIDPSLRHPALKEALDNPPYRARRVMLSAMAWLLGLGQPAWVVQIYCGLNLAAWFFLAALAVRWGGLQNISAVYALLPLLATRGAMQSITLALPDLPATCWIAAALCAARADRGTLAALCLGIGGLTRETALMAIPILLVIPISGPCQWLRRAIWIGIAVLPLAAWCGYVQTRFGAQEYHYGQFEWPLVTMVANCSERFGRSFVTFEKRDLIFILMIISLCTQTAWFLCRKWQWRNALWLVGAGNAGLFLVLGPQIWEDTGGLPQSRICLPMTVAFHFDLMCERVTPGWWRWLVLANLSLPFAVLR